uniref:Uncharacterized protein n=1 Tax=Oryza rufipogon TaxID=4529 RepID=A0A0E0PV31_ORYRU
MVRLLAYVDLLLLLHATFWEFWFDIRTSLCFDNILYASTMPTGQQNPINTEKGTVLGDATARKVLHARNSVAHPSATATRPIERRCRPSQPSFSAAPLPLLSSTREGDARPSTNAACLRRLWGFAGTATCPHIPFPEDYCEPTEPCNNITCPQLCGKNARAYCKPGQGKG